MVLAGVDHYSQKEAPVFYRLNLVQVNLSILVEALRGARRACDLQAAPEPCR